MLLEGRKAVVGAGCTECLLCSRLCDRNAIKAVTEQSPGRVACGYCPVQCSIAEGFTGACRRYRNDAGSLVRTRPLLVPRSRGPRNETIIDPLITGVGAGTTSPCFSPAPYIVDETIDGVDVVTVVSEVPFSYSGLKLKIDTNRRIGQEGARVRRSGRPIGLVETEEYGSKMVALGGVNTLHGAAGVTAARTISELCNGGSVDLRVESGARLQVQVGEVPNIDGVRGKKMRVGCGSAVTAMFAPLLKEVADEVLVLDPGVTGLLSEHMAGRALGMTWSGVTPIGRKSSIGRYFGEAGEGLGGTRFAKARDAVSHIDARRARPGMTLFVTDTAGESGALYRLGDGLELVEMELTGAAREVMRLISENAEDSRVSAVLVAGAGGSARAGVCRAPVRLSEAVHQGSVRLTVGSAPVFLFPGGGITFMVDVEQIPVGAITWVPTPALVIPIEYTMTREQYEKIEGYLDSLRELRAVLMEREHEFMEEAAEPI